jgi:hypothetical protein
MEERGFHFEVILNRSEQYFRCMEIYLGYFKGRRRRLRERRFLDTNF